MAENPDVPNPIVSIDDLATNADVIRAREALHRRVISTLSSVFNEDSTKENLVTWALGGFRPGFTVKELPFEPPIVCSDGVKREIAEYMNFVSTPYTVAEHFAALEACLPGIQVTYSFSSPKTILLHVTKK
jgi:hypothetical protein